MTLYLGIILALACAVVTNLSFFFKYRGANDAPPVTIRRPLRTVRSLFASKWFTIGWLVALAAWVFHVGALAVAPISVVQVVLAGGIVLLAVMAERLFGYHVGRRQFWGVALTAAGLVMLALTLPHPDGASSGFSIAGMIGFEGGLIGLGALLIMGPRISGREHHHGAMLAAASGLLFGVSDVSIKAITGLIGSAGIVGGLVNPWMLVAILASIGAFYASARSFQRGAAVPVIAITATAANVAGIVGGILVFGDPLAGNAVGLAIEALAFAMVVGAAALTPAPIRAAGVAKA